MAFPAFTSFFYAFGGQLLRSWSYFSMVAWNIFIYSNVLSMYFYNYDGEFRIVVLLKIETEKNSVYWLTCHDCHQHL